MTESIILSMKLPGIRESILNHLADTLDRSSLAVFAGAGISLNSGIPLASHIITEVMSNLGADSVQVGDFVRFLNLSNEDAETLIRLLEEQAFLNSDGTVAVSDLRSQNQYSKIPKESPISPKKLADFLANYREAISSIGDTKLPFESFIESIIQDNDPKKLFDIFSIGEPNTSHVLLAKLAKVKKIRNICTTNFDLHIERALNAEGMTCGQDYVVLAREAEFEQFDPEDERVAVIKIHGSVESPDEMAITLKRVAQRELYAQRKRITDHIFSTGPHQCVLVLGYSCSDIFDISPQIESIQEGYKEIIFLQHHAQLGDETIEPVGEKMERNPFKKFPGIRIFANADGIISEIWKHVLGEPYQQKAILIENPRWKESIQKWAENLGGIMRPRLAGEALFKASAYSTAIIHQERSLQAAEEADDAVAKMRALASLGLSYYRLGEYVTAEKYFQESLALAEKHGDDFMIADILGDLGNIARNSERYGEAVVIFNRALAHAKISRNRRIESIIHGDLGMTYRHMKELEKALHHLERALAIARDETDKLREAAFLGGIGNVEYASEKFEKAIEYYQAAESISRDIGDRNNEAILAGNTGNLLFYDLKRPKEALPYLERALEITSNMRIPVAIDHLFRFSSTSHSDFDRPPIPGLSTSIPVLSTTPF